MLLQMCMLLLIVLYNGAFKIIEYSIIMSTNKIYWKNYKIYNHDDITNRMAFVEKGMNGLLPLYGKEKDRLVMYANKRGLDSYEMISLRNTIRIQKEIDSSEIFSQNIGKIKS